MGNKVGYYFLMADCIRCKNIFTCNPDKVPSIRVNGIKEPLCELCVKHLNKIREEHGLEPWPILPDAYEPAAEAEGEFYD